MSHHNETYDIDIVNVHPSPCPICGPTTRETSGSEPTLDILEDQSVTRDSSVNLGVSYHAASPVTITWMVDDKEISTQDNCIPHGQTQITIRRFSDVHHKKRFRVQIVDRRGRPQGTACILTMRH